MRKPGAALPPFLALAFFIGAASAANTSSINLAPKAQFTSGAIKAIAVQATVDCTGGTGMLTVSVTQSPSQSNAGTPASGSGSSSVKCDGQPHKIAVAIVSNFNLGSATATATLAAPSGPASDTRT